ncbi:uncharacterized protein RSE6_11051 [Rhynchosporium secalis]|uniref:MYND-type domain-containing protein n=1 Tax=Rhynchosporium secalis TaxID=38038 RepID=A0A1E1MM01_RHYSE|nr:uncharacterized protein RSE6_11051 [Rhynchosporium secalis]
MGRWGERFFEGDNDLDEASMMGEDAGIELYHYEIDKKEDKDWPLRAKEWTLPESTSTVKGSMSEKELRLVLLGIEQRPSRFWRHVEADPAHMELLRNSYPKIHVSPKYSLPLSDHGFRAPMKKQFKIALAHYKNNGTPFDFDATRYESMECGKEKSDLAKGEELKKCGKCHVVFYCDKECQVKDWYKHKKGCMTPEKRAAKEKRRPSPFGMIMMNL